MVPTDGFTSKTGNGGLQMTNETSEFDVEDSDYLNIDATE